MLSPTHPSGSSPISSSPLAGVRVVAASCDTTGDGSTNVVVQWQENFVVAASSVSVSNATNTVIYKVQVLPQGLRLQPSRGTAYRLQTLLQQSHRNSVLQGIGKTLPTQLKVEAF
jgi:hypothetical protein